MLTFSCSCSFSSFVPPLLKKENNMWNWKMVLTEGFKDIWNLEYILKVNFSSNYVIMVKLLENVKHKINMLPDRKWQKTLSYVSMWVSKYMCENTCCICRSSQAPAIHQKGFYKYKEYTLYVYKASTDMKDTSTDLRVILSVLERDYLWQNCCSS